LNHASFAIECDSELLLIDPWFEGTAFNNGWALLDQTTSNKIVIEYLIKSKKNISIWYSHEHSDHFSISFLKQLLATGIKPTVLFQKTLDRRVFKFLQGISVNIIECEAGKSIELCKKLQITTWSHTDGDSFCLIKVNGINILNLNDCIINSESVAKKIAVILKNQCLTIDFLFTQFGYANWIGNESNIDLRKTASLDKLERLLIQNNILKPHAIIPFASFVYFCHQENFYLNDAQNFPKDIRQSDALSIIQNKIFFMRPWMRISLLDFDQALHELRNSTQNSEIHWNNLKFDIAPQYSKNIKYEVATLSNEMISYIKKMAHNFLLLPQILEILGLIKPLKFYVTDLNETIEISYIKGVRTISLENKWDISLTSEVLHFLIKNQYGFNTTHVNGRYRLRQLETSSYFIKFFTPQEFHKNGLGIQHPILSAKIFIKLILNSFFKIIKK
jgi:hypothetical protein